jgi:hypothetical protein
MAELAGAYAGLIPLIFQGNKAGGGDPDRTASLAGSALKPASPALTEGACPLVCSP